MEQYQAKMPATFQVQGNWQNQDTYLQQKKQLELQAVQANKHQEFI